MTAPAAWVVARGAAGARVYLTSESGWDATWSADRSHARRFASSAAAWSALRGAEISARWASGCELDCRVFRLSATLSRARRSDP